MKYHKLLHEYIHVNEAIKQLYRLYRLQRFNRSEYRRLKSSVNRQDLYKKYLEKGMSCKWLPVSNELCLFELGGYWDFLYNKISFIAYIPYYDEYGIPIKNQCNDMVKSHYRIDRNKIEGGNVIIFNDVLSIKKFLDIIKKTDFTKAEIVYDIHTEISYTYHNTFTSFSIE